MAFEHILVVGGGQEKEGEASAEWRCVLLNLPLKMTHTALMCLRLYTGCAFLFIHSFTVLVYVYLCMCVCAHFVCVFVFACSCVRQGMLVCVH